MKENKDFKVQVRISASERELMDLVRRHDSEMTVSRLFRERLHEYCDENDLVATSGVGALKIG